MLFKAFFTLTDFLSTFFCHLLREEWQNIQLWLWICLFFPFSSVNFCCMCFETLLLGMSHLELCLDGLSTLPVWNDSHFLCNISVYFGWYLYLVFAWHIFSILLFSICLHFKDLNFIFSSMKLGFAFVSRLTISVVWW